jgi:hypothetical protein
MKSCSANEKVAKFHFVNPHTLFLFLCEILSPLLSIYGTLQFMVLCTVKLYTYIVHTVCKLWSPYTYYTYLHIIALYTVNCIL